MVSVSVIQHVFGAAIRTSGLAGFCDGQIHFGVTIPKALIRHGAAQRQVFFANGHAGLSAGGFVSAHKVCLVLTTVRSFYQT